MRSPLTAVGLVLASLTGAAPLAACEHTVASVPVSVHAILAPHYAEQSAGQALRPAQRAIEILMLEAAHCKMAAQSGETTRARQRSAAAEQQLVEGHSLDQWLYRLVNFLGLNAKGDTSVDWRVEYETFAEVYEFAP